MIARIESSLLKAVVTIGVRSGMGGVALVPSWLGTGFVVRKKISETSELYVLITNKHVIAGQKQVVVRLTPIKSATAVDVEVPLYDACSIALYSLHPAVEVDIVAIDLTALLNPLFSSGVASFDNCADCLTLKDMEQGSLAEGCHVYALGFPLNLVDSQHNYPICRLGCISRIASSYQGLEPFNYLVDAQVFPGNSGGPVVTILEESGPDACILKTKLIGIVHSYIPCREVLISAKTGKARSTTEENSGLSNVHPVDRINELLEIECARACLKGLKRGSL